MIKTPFRLPGKRSKSKLSEVGFLGLDRFKNDYQESLSKDHQHPNILKILKILLQTILRLICFEMGVSLNHGSNDYT